MTETVAFDLVATKERLKANPSDDDANYNALWDALHEIERLTRERDEAEKLAESLQNKWASRDLTIERLSKVNQHLEEQLVDARVVSDSWHAEYLKLRDAS